MARYTHEQLMGMSRPASDTEETKMENARNAIMNALNDSDILKSNAYEVFGQGSYANNTNIRNNSDIDINVCYTDAYYFDLPENVTRQELGLNNSVEYSYQSYKNDIEKMLVQYFGVANVVRKNKCIHINGNSYRAEIDVVPTWKYRSLLINGELIKKEYFYTRMTTNVSSIIPNNISRMESVKMMPHYADIKDW